ncbi:cytochrome P450 2C11-like [Sphaerodactylus townsendi]|uniref:cytochrome P450 2C11-like n=1 Tax=Sphaerodactylus townsendi TaxID=933632 RepID=UPI0020271013|nr:cytochrome P450 2C11-like [Sphaerodactylus townsendi]
MDLVWNTSAFLLVNLACLLLLAAWRKRTQKTNLPPGPTPLPFIGNLLQLRASNITATLKQMSEKYGPVFTVYFGTDQTIVLYGYDVVKEVLVDHGDEFTFRGSIPSADKTNKGLGVIMSNGKRWVELRRFSLTTLRNFGMGKKNIEEYIQEETEYVMKELRAQKGQPFSPALLFSCATGNVISHILLGERFDYQDPKYLQILSYLMDAFRLESSISGQVRNPAPGSPDCLPGSRKRRKTFSTIRELCIAGRQSHESSLDLNDPRDFIDCFLIKMEQEKHNPETEFTRDNLMMTGYDLFVAGTETASSTLRYILMILVEHPTVQAKIHEEIDQVIGRERAPSMKDRLQMPYTEAVLHEAQRFMDLVPLGFTRLVKEDIQLRGFTIPKGATIHPILSSALHDPKQFKNPNQFDPENFLDENGAFKKNGADIPFSTGKRICIGESLARMQLFLYSTTILQSFCLKRPPGVTKIDLTPEVSGFGNVPRQLPLCFCPR